MIAKRVFDLFVSLIGLTCLLPLFLLVGLLIIADSPGPVFFRQTRVGRHGKMFDIFKFRTMSVDAEEKGRQITVGKDPRVTRVGTFLRKYKIDELPQLINVICGDMSLVGPRPEVPRYVALYPVGIRERVLSVPPGITDHASLEFKDENEILGNSADPETTYREEIVPLKLRYYERYVAERTLWHDFKLIVLTLKRVFCDR